MELRLLHVYKYSLVLNHSNHIQSNQEIKVNFYFLFFTFLPFVLALFLPPLEDFLEDFCDSFLLFFVFSLPLVFLVSLVVLVSSLPLVTFVSSLPLLFFLPFCSFFTPLASVVDVFLFEVSVFPFVSFFAGVDFSKLLEGVSLDTSRFFLLSCFSGFAGSSAVSAVKSASLVASSSSVFSSASTSTSTSTTAAS